ncbi:PAPOA polymerase, partial [Polyodon spathula]|nr:PAPOA polymerase [Polyodon spathula]
HSTEGIKLMNENSFDLSLDSDNSMSVPSPTAALKSCSQNRSISPQGLSPTSVTNTQSEAQAKPEAGGNLVIPGGILGENILKPPAAPLAPKPSLTRVSSTQVINQTPQSAGTPGTKPGIKRAGSPHPEETPKRLKADEETSENSLSADICAVLADTKMSTEIEVGEVVSSTNDGEGDIETKDNVKRLSSTDLSDVPTLPPNPIPVVKNSIKLRLTQPCLEAALSYSVNLRPKQSETCMSYGNMALVLPTSLPSYCLQQSS